MKAASAGAALVLCGAHMAAAAGPTTLYTFTGGVDGAYPIGGLVKGYKGNFYGTTALGGSACTSGGCGTVFELSPPAAGSSKWTLTTIYQFTGSTDGQTPVNIVADAAGNLYGAAEYGGFQGLTCAVGAVLPGCGTIFELSPPAAGQSGWTFNTLYAFTGGADGNFPNYGITRVASTGAIYGVTYSGGTCATGNCGAVFELTPPGAGQSAWTETTLHDFAGGNDGSAPYGIPYVDAKGNVFGTTSLAGPSPAAPCKIAGGCGSVFELTPPAGGSTVWKKTTIWGFNGANGLFPNGALTGDSAGNLYGTTDMGGNLTACAPGGTTPPGCGTVFELTPPAAGSTQWALATLYAFNGTASGVYPAAGLTARTGYFTTTSGNGAQGYGSVIHLVPPKKGSTAWTETTLFDFTNNASGAQPVDTLLLSAGVLYGTTLGHDGTAPAQYGTIFSIAP